MFSSLNSRVNVCFFGLPCSLLVDLLTKSMHLRSQGNNTANDSRFDLH